MSRRVASRQIPMLLLYTRWHSVIAFKGKAGKQNKCKHGWMEGKNQKGESGIEWLKCIFVCQSESACGMLGLSKSPEMMIRVFRERSLLRLWEHGKYYGSYVSNVSEHWLQSSWPESKTGRTIRQINIDILWSWESQSFWWWSPLQNVACRERWGFQRIPIAMPQSAAAALGSPSRVGSVPVNPQEVLWPCFVPSCDHPCDSIFLEAWTSRALLWHITPPSYQKPWHHHEQDLPEGSFDLSEAKSHEDLSPPTQACKSVAVTEQLSSTSSEFCISLWPVTRDNPCCNSVRGGVTLQYLYMLASLFLEMWVDLGPKKPIQSWGRPGMADTSFLFGMLHVGWRNSHNTKMVWHQVVKTQCNTKALGVQMWEVVLLRQQSLQLYFPPCTTPPKDSQLWEHTCGITKANTQPHACHQQPTTKG